MECGHISALVFVAGCVGGMGAGSLNDLGF